MTNQMQIKIKIMKKLKDKHPGKQINKQDGMDTF
jgi:hypothetical protein